MEILRWSKSDSLATWTTKYSHKIASSFVNGTAELGLFISQEMIVLPKNFWNQDSWIWKFNTLWIRVNFLASMHLKICLNMSLKVHFFHLHLVFPETTVVQWMMNTVRVSIETFLQWRRDIKGSELWYARRLLLDFHKKIPYYGIQATGKTNKQYDFVWVK